MPDPARRLGMRRRTLRSGRRPIAGNAIASSSTANPMLIKIKAFLRDLWLLTRPYWFSEERRNARALLAAVVALNLGIVFVNVELNQWQNAFYNTLQDKDQAEFTRQLIKFCWLAAAFIVMSV